MDCGTFERKFIKPINLTDHFELSSYTNLEFERKFYEQRFGFFKYICDISMNNLSFHGKRNILDIGCSYGHLLEIFRETGAQCFGVEPVEHLRERLIPDFTIYEDIQEIPDHQTFNVITLIDSLYYITDPVSYLKKLKQHMADNSLMIIRVTNRTPLLNILALFNKAKISEGIFGDQLYAFSHRSMRILFNKCGQKIMRTYYEEKGKRLSGFKNFLCYNVMPPISKLTGLKLTPGLIYVCKSENASN